MQIDTRTARISTNGIRLSVTADGKVKMARAPWEAALTGPDPRPETAPSPRSVRREMCACRPYLTGAERVSLFRAAILAELNKEGQTDA